MLVKPAYVAKRNLNNCHEVGENLFKVVSGACMLHWHPSHKSSKPKLSPTTEALLFYCLLIFLIAYLACQWL